MLKPYEDLILTIPPMLRAYKIAEACETLRGLSPFQAAFVVGAIAEEMMLKHEQVTLVRFLNAINGRTS